MKCSRLLSLFAIAILLFVISVGTASATQNTTTCPSGQWDVLSLMFMQQSYPADNYYVYGTSSAGGNVPHNDVPQIATQHNGIWDTGKNQQRKRLPSPAGSRHSTLLGIPLGH